MESASDAYIDSFTVRNDSSITQVVWSAISFMIVLMTIVFMIMCIRVIIRGQKTRNPQQRRMYAGTRPRPSLNTHEPTIYVSPANLPPPPKYECMAPPSYEEVVGVHYPNLQAGQPITQPIETALAQFAQNNTANSSRPNDSVSRIADSVPATTIPNTAVPTSNDSITRPNNDTIVVTVNERQNS